MLGLSQSALVTTLIADDLREMVKQKNGLSAFSPLSAQRASGKRRRLRGASAVVVRETIAEALEAAANLTRELPFGSRR